MMTMVMCDDDFDCEINADTVVSSSLYVGTIGGEARSPKRVAFPRHILGNVFK